VKFMLNINPTLPRSPAELDLKKGLQRALFRSNGKRGLELSLRGLAPSPASYEWERGTSTKSHILFSRDYTARCQGCGRPFSALG
jgi:hypothetical protein